MRRPLTLKRLALVVASMAVLSVALAAVLWPKPPRQIITLSNGDRYEFAGVTYGTNLVPPSLLCHLAGHLSGRLRSLAEKILGQRITWQAVPPKWVSTGNRPVLTVWFRQLQTNSLSRYMGSAPLARLADQNNFAVQENGGGPALYIAGLSRSSGWYGQEFSIVPKRSPILHLLLDVSSNPTEHVTFRNPVYGTFPQWQPKDTLPATINLPDLHVRIDDWDTSDTLARTSLWNDRNTGWTITDAELSDATGNVLHRYRPHLAFTGPQSVEVIIFSGTLWPGENAWRLRIQLQRTNSAAGPATHTIELFVKPPSP